MDEFWVQEERVEEFVSCGCFCKYGPEESLHQGLFLLSHEALPQDAYTKYTLYTTHEYVCALVAQLAAIIQISYIKNR